MEDPKNKHTGSTIDTIFEDDEPSQEITQGGDVVRKRGRPRKPPAENESMTPAQVEELYKQIVANQEERPEPELENESQLNQHNKKLIRLIQIILNEDFKLMSYKNFGRISTPNGIQKVEIAGLTDEQRKHLRETLKILVLTVKMFDESSNPKDVGNDRLRQLANELYKGVPRPNGK